MLPYPYRLALCSLVGELLCPALPPPSSCLLSSSYPLVPRLPVPPSGVFLTTISTSCYVAHAEEWPPDEPSPVSELPPLPWRRSFLHGELSLAFSDPVDTRVVPPQSAGSLRFVGANILLPFWSHSCQHSKPISCIKARCCFKVPASFAQYSHPSWLHGAVDHVDVVVYVLVLLKLRRCRRSGLLCRFLASASGLHGQVGGRYRAVR